jgi:hypothetical protein
LRDQINLRIEWKFEQSAVSHIALNIVGVMPLNFGHLYRHNKIHFCLTICCTFYLNGYILIATCLLL